MNEPHDPKRTVEQTKRHRRTLALTAMIVLAMTLSSGGPRVRADEDARQAQVARDVNDALNRAKALLAQSRSAVRGGAVLYAQAREQAQRALALVENGPADAALQARVRQLMAELDEEEKDSRLIAALDEARLAQAEIVAGESRFAVERAVPLFQEAFRAYGLPAGEGKPAAAAGRIRQRPAAVREAIVAALDEWDDLAGNPIYGSTEPHREWLRAVLAAAEPDDAWGRKVRAARREPAAAKRQAALEALLASADFRNLPARSLTRLAVHLRPPQAAAALRRAWQQYPADFWVNLELGVELTKVTPPEWNEAVRFLTAAVALRPEAPGVYSNLAAALAGTGQVDEAIACFHKAIELDPKLALAHDGLGHALLARGQLDEAIACWRRVITLGPKYASAHNNLGFALARKGQIDEAIASYRMAIALDPKYAQAHFNLGIALEGKGQVDEAIACFKKAIELGPTFAAAHTNLGTALKARGEVDAAIACFRKAIALDPKFALARTNLANAERLAAARDKLPAFQNGSYTPANNEDRLGLVEWCQIRKLPLTATGLYAAAFAADPRLADDLKAGHRYNAACSAALAAAGQGEDAGKLDDKERTRLRMQALDWLRSDLTTRQKQLTNRWPGEAAQARAALVQWQEDTRLAGLRDAALAKLPPKERAAFEGLWTDVAMLLKKAQP
jgi:tetratricopeptide (TPR) repeat protein